MQGKENKEKEQKEKINIKRKSKRKEKNEKKKKKEIDLKLINYFYILLQTFFTYLTFYHIFIVKPNMRK